MYNLHVNFIFIAHNIDYVAYDIYVQRFQIILV